MAKKKTQMEVISEETSITSEIEKIEEKTISTHNLKDLTLTELVDAEKAVNTVCKKYENSLRNYDGTILRNTKEYDIFQKFNDLHTRIITEMENKLEWLNSRITEAKEWIHRLQDTMVEITSLEQG